MPQQLQLHSFWDLWHPGVFAWCLLVQVAYLLLVGPIREGYRWGTPVPTIQKVWFAIGLWTVYISEGTPLHLLAETYLFSAHMVQHVLLTMVFPPLLILGIPAWIIRPFLRPRWAAAIFRLLTHPFPALMLFNLIYSIWHMPLAYQSTLWYHWFHMVQHAVLVLTAFLMWWPICSPLPEFPRLTPPMQMLFIFLQGVAQLAVFGMITFADNAIYDFYAAAPRVWPLITPLIDQQLSGIVMKVGGGGIMVLTWAIVFFKWAAREQATGEDMSRATS